MEPYLQKALDDAALGMGTGMAVFGYVVIAIFMGPVFDIGRDRGARCAKLSAQILWPLAVMIIALGVMLIPFVREEETSRRGHWR
jgi:hypothetical protein